MIKSFKKNLINISYFLIINESIFNWIFLFYLLLIFWFCPDFCEKTRYFKFPFFFTEQTLHSFHLPPFQFCCNLRKHVLLQFNNYQKSLSFKPQFLPYESLIFFLPTSVVAHNHPHFHQQHFDSHYLFMIH